MFALLSASYMLALLTADPCISEMENVPGKNETIVYKCFPPDVKSLKDETRVPLSRHSDHRGRGRVRFHLQTLTAREQRGR